MKMMMTVAATALAMAAMADKVTLKSGSALIGETGAINGETIAFKSDELGELQLKLADIAELEPAKAHQVVYADGRSEEKILGVRNGEVFNGEGKFDTTNVKKIDPVPEKWHGSVNIAFQAARGNTYNNSGSVVANVNRRWEKDRLNVDFGYYYGESGQVGEERQKTLDRWELEAKHDHFWAEKIYHYENGRFENDAIQELDARYRLGIGAGYQWLENYECRCGSKWSFNQEVGVNYVNEQYKHPDPGQDESYCAVRYAHQLKFIPGCAKSVEFFHNFEYLPDVSEWQRYLINTDLGFTTKIIFDFDLLAKVEWDYNSMPAGDRKQSDLRYLVGLGYKW